MFSLKTQGVIARSRGLGFSVENAKLSEDGLILVGTDGSWGFWEEKAGFRLIGAALGHNSVESTFSHDGSKIALLLHGEPMVLDTKNGTSVELKNHQGEVLSIALSVDGKRAVTSGVDCAMRIWDSESGDQRGCFTIDSKLPPDYCSISENGQRVLGVSARYVLILDLTDHVSRTIHGDDAELFTCAALSPDGSFVVCGHLGESISAWDIGSGKELWRRDTDWPVRYLSFSPSGNYLLCVENDCATVLRNSRTGRQFAALRGLPESVLATAWSKDGSSFAVADATGGIQIWRIEHSAVFLFYLDLLLTAILAWMLVRRFRRNRGV